MKFLRNRSTVVCLLALAVQQVIVASSTYWLVSLSRDVIEGESFWVNLCLYLTSLLLPYLPLAVASVSYVKWEQVAIQRYIGQFVHNNVSRVHLWGDKVRRESILTIVNNEGMQTITNAVFYFYQLASSILNVTFNIITISILIDYYFPAAYVVSVAIGFLIIRTQKRRLGDLTRGAQDGRIRVGQTILSSWDNVVLGNHYNLRLWKKSAQKNLLKSIKLNVVASVYSELVAIGIALVTFVPSLLVAAFSMYSNVGNILALSALIVTMPRLFLVLSYTYDLLYQVVQCGMTRAKLHQISTVLAPGPHDSPEAYRERINWPALHFDEKRSHEESFEDELISKVTSPNRITIRGRNGSGKSSLLLLLKQRLREHAYYLPSQHQLLFSFGTAAQSTGESVRAQLEEIRNKVHTQAVLLDEWDANLDEENQSYLSTIIDEIASRCCVIEVRHSPQIHVTRVASGE